MELSVERSQPDHPPDTAVAPSPADAVPVSAVFRAAARVVRRLDGRADRQIELSARGGEAVSLHPLVLARATDAVERLVAGAALSEIEPPGARKQAGKLPAGRIGLAAYEHTGAAVIEVTDDGRGRAADALQHHDAVAAARAAVEAAGGSLSIASIAGVGTTFTLRLPLPSAVVEALVVRMGDARYVLPRSAVVQILPRFATGWRPAAWFARLLRRVTTGPQPRGVTLVLRGADGARPRRFAADGIVGREQVVLDSATGTARLRSGAALPVLDGRGPHCAKERAPRIAAA